MVHLISARRPDIVIVNKGDLDNYRVKRKENEKRDKYLDLAREQKKQVTVIPVVTGALSTVTKVQGLEDLEIRGRVDTIQTTELLRSTRILRRVLETRRDLLPLKI